MIECALCFRSLEGFDRIPRCSEISGTTQKKSDIYRARSMLMSMLMLLWGREHCSLSWHASRRLFKMAFFLPFQVSTRAANARKRTSRGWPWTGTCERNAAESCIPVRTVATSCQWSSIYWITWRRSTVAKI